MPNTLKRKGSPSLEADSGESPKRRFAEGEESTTQDDAPTRPSTDPTPAQDVDNQAATTASATATPPADDRAARFAALRLRASTSKHANLQATKAESKRAAIDPSALTSLNRKKDIASHKLLRAEIEDSGGDFERQRAWDWTAEESSRWDERMAEKKERREGNKFATYQGEAGKVYERQIAQMEKAGAGDGGRREGYEREKAEALDRAVRSGGLELVETADGELIAVDKEGSFYSTADSTAHLSSKPSKEAVDRLVADIKKAEEVRLKKRRDRGKEDGADGDVSYINEKNKQFNMKLARFYNKYTADIRESFERGTAI